LTWLCRDPGLSLLDNDTPLTELYDLNEFLIKLETRLVETFHK